MDITEIKEKSGYTDKSEISAKRKWLLLNYNLPTEPSRPRVAAWRKLKKLGAVNIQQSMWIMIYNDENYNYLKEVSNDIELNSGTSFLMEGMFFDENHEEKVISLFNEMRDEEYSEFISECKKYLSELKKEILIEKFTFAELEEEEEELQKLKSWHTNIQLRDIFKSEMRNEACDYLVHINKSFENYSEMVYNHQLNK